MNINENKVTLDLETFLKIRDESMKFNEILDIIFNSITDLSFSKKSVRFYEEEINNYLKFVAPNRYKQALEELQEREENK